MQYSMKHGHMHSPAENWGRYLLQKA